MELKQEHLARDDVRSLRIVRLRWRIAPAVVVVGDQVPIRKLPCMDRCMCNVEEDETHIRRKAGDIHDCCLLVRVPSLAA